MSALLKNIPQHRVLGVPVHAATMDQTLSICVDAIRRRSPLMVGVVNAAKVVKMRQDSLLRESVLDSHLIVADGIAVVWASRLLRRPLPQRVAGIDLFEKLLAVANEHSYSVYFLGAEQAVLRNVITHVKKKFPNVRIAGSRDGYFDVTDSPQVADDIRASNADILFLGMTSPKKEIFMARWGNTLNVCVCHGVGGSFDVMAGKVKRAPQLWQTCGMEWLYRVVQEPRRMWKRYLVTNTIFIAMLAREMLRRGIGAVS